MSDTLGFSTTLEWAQWYISQGISVIPVKCDGSKSPAILGWREYSDRRPTLEELTKWFSAGRLGIGVPCGSASGNLVVLDFECRNGRPAYTEWLERLPDDLRQYASTLPTVITPSGGRHIWIQLDHIHPGTKLAKYVTGQIKIEIRNVGHQVLAPGSPAACHKTGKLYRWNTDPVFQVVPHERWCDFYHYAVECNEVKPSEKTQPPPSASGSPAGKGSPGTDFNLRGSWADTGLFEEGWTWCKSVDSERGYLTRPGKKTGISASIGIVTSRQQGIPYFYVWSTSVKGFEPETPYSRFAVFATLKHGGDYVSAARDLATRGFGERESSESYGINLDDFFGKKANQQQQKPESKLAYRSIDKLVSENPRLRDPVIHGLLRSGETMNVIAAPKSRKSWLILDLSICVALGKPWLGQFKTEQGSVLIIDNELHPETLAARVPDVADRLGTSPEMIGNKIMAVNLRGSLVDLRRLAEDLVDLEPGFFKLIVLDAFYRFMPSKVDENSNSEMASLYNLIDMVALKIGCAFILVHHTSKGVQSGKSVTDVGAGAGSQSRAADTHLVLRPHDEPGCIVLDAATRSWPPLESVVLRWNYPTWSIDQQLDPNNYMQEKKTSDTKKQNNLQVIIVDLLSEKPKSGELWRLNSFIKRVANDAKESVKKVTDTIDQLEKIGVIKLIEGPWSDIRPRDNVAIILSPED